ncbi:IclR family transcriptional regulator [Streptomyces sp. ML-6]|uniref:IclR family transcriptional regulator n=1 Tax=Streptomyces sp. ML-6 TaxID=2982693 RepID=UPI0024C0C1D4|nr:IclR family transcriptional regulator [Streptomyces sp. ML-6]MDK0524225.1 IclR family transcriptional regulator [Streptomyces sp. ML-6]
MTDQPLPAPTPVDVPGSSLAPSVLWKAFRVLGAFSHSRRVLTLAQIMRRSELPKSTTHRVLAMLLEVGAVEQHNGGYRVGLRMFTLGALPPEVALRDAAMVHLQELHRVTGQTLHLAILRDGEAVYLEKLRSRKYDPSPAVVGGRLPAHCTAIGKAMLAFSQERVVADALAGPLPRRTAHSLVSAEGVRRQLAAIRTDGFAVDREEAVEGLACVAVPILAQHRAVAAVSVGFAASAGSGHVLVSSLRQAAGAISRSLVSGSALQLLAAGR